MDIGQLNALLCPVLKVGLVVHMSSLSHLLLQSEQSDLPVSFPHMNRWRLEQSDFLAFVSDGHVSLVGSGIKVPVKILRDTKAFDSFIVSYTLSFSWEIDTGD